MAELMQLCYDQSHQIEGLCFFPFVGEHLDLHCMPPPLSMMQHALQIQAVAPVLVEIPVQQDRVLLRSVQYQFCSSCRAPDCFPIQPFLK